MLYNLYEYCESPIEPNVKNKGSAYEYLIKRFFESYFWKTNYSINLFPIIERHDVKGKFLTPDIELCFKLNNNKIIIVIEIKYFEDSSINKKVARTKSRQRMRDYKKAYEIKFPDTIIMPLFITQNPSFNNNPDNYPCIVIPLKELNKDNPQKVIQMINESIQTTLKK